MRDESESSETKSLREGKRGASAMASKFQMSHVEMTLAMIKPDAEKVRDRIYMATKACTPVSLYFFCSCPPRMYTHSIRRMHAPSQRALASATQHFRCVVEASKKRLMRECVNTDELHLVLCIHIYIHVYHVPLPPLSYVHVPPRLGTLRKLCS